MLRYALRLDWSSESKHSAAPVQEYHGISHLPHQRLDALRRRYVAASASRVSHGLSDAPSSTSLHVPIRPPTLPRRLRRSGALPRGRSEQSHSQACDCKRSQLIKVLSPCSESFPSLPGCIVIIVPGAITWLLSRLLLHVASGRPK